MELERELGVGSKVDHLHFGKGVIVDKTSETYNIWFKSQNGTKVVSKDFTGLTVVEKVEADAVGPLSIADIEEALDNVLERRMFSNDLVQMASKWNGGTLRLVPGDTSLLGKDVPIDQFYNKIIMVRDRVRLIEQKINANKTLTPDEKIDIQQYITGIYGSLTTFNVLFKEIQHQFKGSGKD